MTRPLRLHDAADVELNEAADYYDLESPGLAITYATRPDTIRVLAIAHQRKRPYYWRSRG